MQAPSNLPSLAPRRIEQPFVPGINLFGAASRKPRYVAPAPPRKIGPAASLPFEPEDAQLTGATRSLSRRLLGLNLPLAS